MKQPDQLVDFLKLKYKNDAFHPITAQALNVPSTALWYGGIEIKTVNLHRAVCVLEVAKLKVKLSPLLN